MNSKKDKKDKIVTDAIEKMLKENPDLTVKEIIWTFTDWLGYMCVEKPHIFPYFQECFFKWIAYYVKRNDRKDFKRPD